MSAGAAAKARLLEERKMLAKDKPFGCYGKPLVNKATCSTEVLRWEVGILPLAGSDYALPESGTYRVILDFAESYPTTPPKVTFSPVVFHPNLFTDGRCCLSLLLEEGHHGGRDGLSFWTPTISIATIISALQQFLEKPNPESIASQEACDLYKRSKVAFRERVKREADSYKDRLAGTPVPPRRG
jgi:ubiquitin-protein ligase